ncbi:MULTISPECIES: hypothetical protein [Methanopyrus]|uniref:Uncharacterized protein n=1 Tax=Methanopyrus kandleri TaxID=2320 RepID=A0A832WPS7_9EURY|nr:MULTISPECIES: hypothetical protein [Methanopyrus]HII70879.1 hypothetical protein [Methanopyrus kandleri]
MREEDKRRLMVALVRVAPIVATVTLIVGFTVFVILVLTGHSGTVTR